jgi:hypothetical protein
VIGTIAVLLLVAGCSSNDNPPANPDRGSTLEAGKADSPLTFAEGPVAQPDGPKAQPDGPKAQPDGPKAQPDGPKAQPDGPKAQPDGPAKYDGATNLNCNQIGDCSDKCGAGCKSGDIFCLTKCSNDCKAKGCPKAQAAFGTVYTCVSTKCMLDCFSGPTPACKTCVKTKCAAEVAACDAQTC